jgi:hypothetical protein
MCKILFAIRKFVVLKNYWFVLNVCFLTHVLGKGLFCCRKPTKTEKVLNENTHYQRAHKKNVVMSFFSSDSRTKPKYCFARSIDDKAYLRPGNFTFLLIIVKCYCNKKLIHDLVYQ